MLRPPPPSSTVLLGADSRPGCEAAEDQKGHSSRALRTSLTSLSSSDVFLSAVLQAGQLDLSLEGGADSPLGKLVVSSVYEGGAADKHGQFTKTMKVKTGSDTRSLPVMESDVVSVFKLTQFVIMDLCV